MRILPNSFYKVSSILLPKPKISQENYRPICTMNKDAKILNRILANQIPQETKNIHHNRLEFYSRNVRLVQRLKISQWFNTPKKKKHTIIIVNAESIWIYTTSIKSLCT